MAKRTLIVGRFTEDRSFITKEGPKTIQLRPKGDDTHDQHFLDDDASAENYAVIRGVEDGDVIRDATIINVLDTLPSALLARLLESQQDESIDDRQARVKDLSDRVLDEIPLILGVPLEEDDPPPPEEIPDVIPLRKPLLAIVVGHSEADKGATSPFPPNTHEWDYNSVMADLIENSVRRVETVIVFREPTPGGYKRLPGRINALNPDLVISLHCNAASSDAFGTEMIHCPGSTDGELFAAILQREVSNVFGWVKGKPGYRGVKTPFNNRGMQLLRGTHAPCVIVEPFFLSNESDYRNGLDRAGELGKAYSRAIDEFSKTIAESLTPSDDEVAPVPVEEQLNPPLLHRGLTKKEFFSMNNHALAQMIESSNQWAQSCFGGIINQVTKADIYLVGTCEMGLDFDQGIIDIDFVHSKGEKGLFPLPSNLAFWLSTSKTGRSTPRWNSRHSLEANTQAFIDYLTALKNKVVKTSGETALYRDLFETPHDVHSEIISAKILAAVVHGYFYDQNYQNKTIPFNELIRALESDRALSSIMNDTTFVHGGKVMKGREANLIMGESWLRTDTDSGIA